jgi:hypothetical protein
MLIVGVLDKSVSFSLRYAQGEDCQIWPSLLPFFVSAGGMFSSRVDHAWRRSPGIHNGTRRTMEKLPKRNRHEMLSACL